MLLVIKKLKNFLKIDETKIEGKPELIYFNAQGRAEQIRLALHYAGVEFLDTRLDFNKFGEKKQAGEFTYGSLPIYKEGDFQLAQGPVICYYVGKKNGLVPKDVKEDSECFSILLSCEDLRMSFFNFYFCKNEEEKKKNFFSYENFAKLWIQNMEKLVKSTGFIFENRITVADLTVFDILNNFIKTSKIPIELPEKLSLLNNHIWNDRKLSNILIKKR